jgi:site-specific recombinase XerD
VDRYLEFVAGRCRPNTLRAVAFDLKAFFAVTGKDPVEVTAADVFEFLAHQRGDRTVVRLADRESGLSARTIARRLSSVSGLYAYLVARGDTPVQVNPVPRGLLTRRAGGSVRSRTAPLVRVPRTLPRILSPGEADRLVAALRTHRDRAMVLAMLLAGLRRCEVLGLRFADVQVADRRLAVTEGKGGHHRVVPAANRFDALGAYLHDERPGAARTDRVFVVLKGPRRGLPLSAEGLDEILAGARRRAGLDHATCHELRHTCLTRLREAGMALEAVQAQAGHASIESTRVYLHLSNDWLATEYRRAAEPAGERAACPRAGREPGGARQHRRRAVGADPGHGAAGDGDDPAVSAAPGRVLGPGQRGRRGERAAPVRPVADHRRRAGQHRRGAPR